MKLMLDPKALTDGFFEDTRLMGIMAPMKDYLFCWQLNHFLGVDFRNNNEIEIQLNKKTRSYFFSVYEYPEQHSTIVHYLYNNQCEGEYLLPEFKHLDFLWLLKGDEVADNLLQQLLCSVREIKGVQLAIELSVDKMKNREHLVF